MARVKDNLIIKGSSGKLGDIIFKQYSYGTVISKVPDRSNVKLSKKQKQANKRFQEAVKFAKAVLADPAQHKNYQKEIKKGKTLYHAALAHYLRDSAAQ